jgi:hypothetical protein
MPRKERNMMLAALRLGAVHRECCPKCGLLQDTYVSADNVRFEVHTVKGDPEGRRPFRCRGSFRLLAKLPRDMRRQSNNPWGGK